ncbi:MAG: MBL fold metallo-hydrolase [Clostridia bacterium]|nr:MBL fold metallo-hydrolase [Clostridia bacterium]
MFELKKVKDNTYYFDAYANVGLFINKKGQVILIDSCDHKRTVRTFNKILEEKGLKPDVVICTHCHVDHIAGNRFFQEKYGAKILCSDKERMFIKYPEVEPDIMYNGCSVNKKLNPNYQGEPSEPEVFSEDNLPEGIELIPMPGHAWQMVGVKTEDNVIFLADSIMSEETWSEHKLPFFNDVNKSIETLEMVKGLEADIFIASHAQPLEDIKPLADLNISKIKERKQLLYELCNENSADELFVLFMKELDIDVQSNRYQTYYVMMRHYLQALIEDKLIEGEFNGEKYVYRKK